MTYRGVGMEKSSEKQRRARGTGTFIPGKGVKEGKILYRVPLPNGKRKQFEGKNQEEAYRKYKKWLKEHPTEQEGKRELAWFSDYVNDWMENVGKVGLKTQSYERNKRTIRTYVIPYLGKYRLINLDTKTIQNELVNRMTNEPNATTGKPNSFSTIKKPYDIVNACLKYAVKMGDITSNPCENVVLPKERKTDAKQIRPLTDDEAKRFLSACEVGMSQYEWVYKLILYTGLRMGEACALRPADIHLSEKYIDVHGTIIEQNEKYIYQGKTKTNKNRRVYINDDTKKMLEERLLYCPKNYYLANLSKDVVNLAYFGREYKAVCKRAGVENVRGLHDLRHTYATKLIRQGIDIKTVSEQLGNSTVSFTLKTYVHTVDSEKAEKMNALNWD